MFDFEEPNLQGCVGEQKIWKATQSQIFLQLIWFWFCGEHSDSVVSIFLD